MNSINKIIRKTIQIIIHALIYMEKELSEIIILNVENNVQFC